MARRRRRAAKHRGELPEAPRSGHRVVVDANVLKYFLVSADREGASCVRDLLEVCCVLVLSKKLRDETQGAVHAEGLRTSRTGFAILMAALPRGKVLWMDPSRRSRLPRMPREDEHVVRLALEAEVDWIVSDDTAFVSAVLRWARGRGIQVVRSREMLLAAKAAKPPA